MSLKALITGADKKIRTNPLHPPTTNHMLSLERGFWFSGFLKESLAKGFAAIIYEGPGAYRWTIPILGTRSWYWESSFFQVTRVYSSVLVAT